MSFKSWRFLNRSHQPHDRRPVNIGEQSARKSNRRGGTVRTFNLSAFLHKHQQWEEANVGYKTPTAMLDQIQLEVDEARAAPTDPGELADIVLTAFVALLMLGLSPAEICRLMVATQEKVMGRTYPRTGESEVIAHV